MNPQRIHECFNNILAEIRIQKTISDYSRQLFLHYTILNKKSRVFNH